MREERKNFSNFLFWQWITYWQLDQQQRLCWSIFYEQYSQSGVSPIHRKGFRHSKRVFISPPQRLLLSMRVKLKYFLLVGKLKSTDICKNMHIAFLYLGLLYEIQDSTFGKNTLGCYKIKCSREKSRIMRLWTPIFVPKYIFWLVEWYSKIKIAIKGD